MIDRITGRLNDGTAFVHSETGNEGVGHYTTQRRLPEIINKLAKYEDAEEQGRIIVPPCEIGQTVYFFRIPTHKEPYISEETVHCMDCYITENGVDFRITGGYFFAYARDIGVRIFLTEKQQKKH